MALTEAIMASAAEYGRYGYQRITAMLRAQGWRVNAKQAKRVGALPRRIAKIVRAWLGRIGVPTLFIERDTHGRPGTTRASTASHATKCSTGRSSSR